jgi:biotin carboxylase
MLKLAIIGASYLQLPVYLKATEMGHKTIGFAWPEGAVAKDFCTKFYAVSTLEKEQILEICINEKIDGILTIATDIAVPTVNFVATKMGLIGNSVDCGENATNKYLMRNAFKSVNINCPDFYLITKENPEFVKTQIKSKFPLIVKPVDRSGSKGITRVNNYSELSSAINIAVNESLIGNAIVEAFIEGTEISIESISFQGKHYILAITDKVTSGPPHYVELEHHQPSLLPTAIQEIAIEETKKALDSLKIKNGAAHSEFIISDGEVFITEVGARMGGDFIGSDLVYLSTGYDFLKGVIQVALNQFETPQNSWDQNSGVLFYSVLTPNIYKVFENQNHREAIVRSEHNSSELKPLTQSSDRNGYILYQANERISN